MKIKIAICDDEKHELETIRLLLTKISAEADIKTEFSSYNNSRQLLEIIDGGAFDFDMVFLDMYIDEKIGLDLAQAIRKKNNCCVIIFITAFSDRMAECFEWKVSDYLTKPIEKDKLAKAFQIGLTHLEKTSMFFVSVKNKDFTIPFDEIIYFENNLKSVKLYRINEIEPLVFSGTVSDINAPTEYFHFCHKSFLVNFLHIKMIDKSKHNIVMKNGVIIHISRKHYTGIVADFTRFHSSSRL